MPPKVKVTKEEIINAAVNIVRSSGAQAINARTIASVLNCSTQPVLYHFATVEDIKKAVYKKADAYHSDYIMNMENDYGDPMLTMGMNYINFARKERNIFQFLFQSNEFSGASILDLLEMEEILPLLTVLQQELELSLEEVKEVFSTLFIFVHGYASLYANNTMIYEEANVISAVEKVFEGAICVLKGDQNEKNI